MVQKVKEYAKAFVPIVVGAVAAGVLLVKGETEQALAVLALFGLTGGLVAAKKNAPPE